MLVVPCIDIDRFEKLLARYLHTMDRVEAAVYRSLTESSCSEDECPTKVLEEPLHSFWINARCLSNDEWIVVAWNARERRGYIVTSKRSTETVKGFQNFIDALGNIDEKCSVVHVTLGTTFVEVKYRYRTNLSIGRILSNCVALCIAIARTMMIMGRAEQ